MPTTTLADIAVWAANDKMKRYDKFYDALDYAKLAYLSICNKVPFPELQTSGTLTTTSGTNFVQTSSLSPNLAGIISVRIAFSSSSGRRLRRSHVRVYDALNNVTTTGKPATYARFGTKLELNPVPDAAYTVTVRYWQTPTIATEVGDTQLLIPNEWDELLRYETLYRLYIDLEMHDKAAGLMISPIPVQRMPTPRKVLSMEQAVIPRLWNDLLLTVDRREGWDEDFSINPIVREYSHAR